MILKRQTAVTDEALHYISSTVSFINFWATPTQQLYLNSLVWRKPLLKEANKQSQVVDFKVGANVRFLPNEDMHESYPKYFYVG